MHPSDAGGNNTSFFLKEEKIAIQGKRLAQAFSLFVSQ